jgi:hypothetical protein
MWTPAPRPVPVHAAAVPEVRTEPELASESEVVVVVVFVEQCNTFLPPKFLHWTQLVEITQKTTTYENNICDASPC